jgi:pimeloyl-ACP methyl ester carboxylesterase
MPAMSDASHNNLPPTTSVVIEGVQLEVLHIPAPSDAKRRTPLVFLHEGLGSVSLWGTRHRYWPQELCSRTGRAGVVYSRRGYGQSDAIPNVRGAGGHSGFWRTGRHAADYMHVEAFEVLPRLLAACGVERPVLVGHSDGATIALLHASRHPVTACIAMAPHVFVEEVALRSIAQARDAYLQQDLRDRLSRHHQNVDCAFWQWNDVWLSDEFRAFDMRADCRRIRSPLMLVQGKEDEYGTLAQLDEIEAAAPQAERLELDACGHSPHRDQPEALTHGLEAFLRDLP